MKIEALKRKQEERSAILIISGELSRLIKWHEYLIKYKSEERPFEIWGMFIPTNSFWKYRDIMQKILNTDDYKDLEDAYINFGVHDRQMQSVREAWSVSGQDIPTVPAVRWREVFWSSITSDDTKNLINRLELIFDKLRVMNT
jgi:hypothetical protein